ncbi:MAG: sigma-70 family RNA polymerase sigma factor [Clostridiales bacterium]|jgi:RNA polymerase sigma-70 factor (ECF subfamily)|nr:sigma-70 family RNA polymerase sigma factor [Clostridiales bacterium]
MLLFTVITDTERAQLGLLIEGVAMGERESLSEIYRLAGGRMLSVAMGYAKSLPFAEDILQDVFIKVAQSAHTFLHGTNGYAWLCTIVRNTALNALRAEKHRRGEDIDSFFSLSDPKDGFGEIENASLVHKAMQALDKEERLMIWLKYFNEMTVREIAAEVNVSKSTVADRIAKAEEKMKRVLRNL